MATKFNIKRSLWLVLLILSFWKESRDLSVNYANSFYLWRFYIYFRQDMSNTVLWRSHFRWTVGLFDWLPDFLFFWTCSSDPKYFSNEPKPKSLQNFIPFFCVIYFLDQTIWVCLHCVWPELLFFKSDEWWNSIFEARTSLQKRLGPHPNKGSNQEQDAMERKLRCRGWELIVNMEE